MVSFQEVVDATAKALVQASTTFSDDQMGAYKLAMQNESSTKTKWVLEQIIKNAEVAASVKLPLCDDTGIPHVFVRIGEMAQAPGYLFSGITEGIKLGLKQLPGRPMAVKGSGLDLLGQTQGMYEDGSMLAHAPISVKTQPGSNIDITVLMLGGGPEIRGKTYRVFHKHEGINVIKEVAEWAAENAAKLGCTPTVPLVGIGRTQYEAASLMLEAMVEADFSKQSEEEKMITAIVNETKVGGLGLGGETTALAAFLKIGPQRASGVRIVSLRLGCCFDPRKSTVTLN